MPYLGTQPPRLLPSPPLLHPLAPPLHTAPPRLCTQTSPLLLLRGPEAYAFFFTTSVETLNLHLFDQALLDTYTIRDELGRLDNISLGVVGDLANGRTVHSLCITMSMYKNVKMYFIAPEVVKMKQEVKDYMTAAGVEWEEVDNLKDVASTCDVLYQTRIQKERFIDNPEDYELAKGKFIIDNGIMDCMKKDAIVMHPLPRVDEVPALPSSHCPPPAAAACSFLSSLCVPVIELPPSPQKKHADRYRAIFCAASSCHPSSPHATLSPFPSRSPLPHHRALTLRWVPPLRRSPLPKTPNMSAIMPTPSLTSAIPSLADCRGGGLRPACSILPPGPEWPLHSDGIAEVSHTEVDMNRWGRRGRGKPTQAHLPLWETKRIL